MTTAQEAMDAALTAQDDANEARREVAGVAGRMGALERTVDTHRQESQDAHKETQRMVREVAESVAHLKGAASVSVPAKEEPSVTLTPAKVLGAAKWVGLVLGALGFWGAVSECSGQGVAATHEVGKP